MIAMRQELHAATRKIEELTSELQEARRCTSLACQDQQSHDVCRSCEDATAKEQQCSSCERLRSLVTEARSRSEALRELLDTGVKSEEGGRR
eukprot:766752-Hanusia_phi.AAC.8